MNHLASLFSPSSIAIVGASSEPASGTNSIFLTPLRQYGFRGPIYPINPKVSEIMGLPAYPSLSAVPGPVDYVICAVAAGLTLPLVEECQKKGVKILHIFSAGFSESGPEGARLEAELVSRARRGGVRVLGPNCFGASYPRSGLCSMPDMGKEPGGVAIISQSAATARDLTESGSRRGLKFGKVVHYGNAADINETELLEFMGEEEESKIVAVYLEGVKDRRFLSVLRRVAARKPVLVLKGGRSEAGSRAALSHTGSLAGSAQVWRAVLRQAGAIPVETVDEMEDLLVTFTVLRPPQGRRVGIVIFGGGFCVQAADECQNEGLQVPALPPETQAQFREFISAVGTSLKNPLDVPPAVVWREDRNFRTLAVLDSCPEIDIILTRAFIPVSTYLEGPHVLEAQAGAIIRAGKELKKPVVLVSRYMGSPGSGEIMVRLLEACREGGVPLYPSVVRAARSLRTYLEFMEKRP